SGRIAFNVTAVSISVSPFVTEDAATFMFITSALSRLPAISNEACVRVEDSKKRLISVRPVRTSRFLPFWRIWSAALSARSRRKLISFADKPSQVSKWRRGKVFNAFEFGFGVIKVVSIGGVCQPCKGASRDNAG